MPDLRGAYLRMAGVNHTNSAWDGGTINGFQEDNTARPKAAFTGNTNNTGNHSHGMNTNRNSTGWRSGGTADRALVRQGGSDSTAPSGDHWHTVSITAGGDTETRPKTYSVNYFIKIN